MTGCLQFLRERVPPTAAVIHCFPYDSREIARDFNNVTLERANVAPNKLFYEITQFKRYILPRAGLGIAAEPAIPTENFTARRNDGSGRAHNTCDVSRWCNCLHCLPVHYGPMQLTYNRDRLRRSRSIGAMGGSMQFQQDGCSNRSSAFRF